MLSWREVLVFYEKILDSCEDFRDLGKLPLVFFFYFIDLFSKKLVFYHNSWIITVGFVEENFSSAKENVGFFRKLSNFCKKTQYLPMIRFIMLWKGAVLYIFIILCNISLLHKIQNTRVIGIKLYLFQTSFPIHPTSLPRKWNFTSLPIR